MNSIDVNRFPGANKKILLKLSSIYNYYNVKRDKLMDLIIRNISYKEYKYIERL